MNKTKLVSMAVAGALVAGCAAMTSSDDEYTMKAIDVMKHSFKDRGQAKVDRLNQDEVQKVCTEYAQKPIPQDVARKLEAGEQAHIKLPADGNYMGDWKEGEKVAQYGRGKQFSDKPGSRTGGNCYACHQLTKQELSYGTIGPSLYNFGKIRGFTAANQKYAYSKVYNSQAFSACSSMPRFGHFGVLSEKQIKDVTALLMDPHSPVNQ